MATGMIGGRSKNQETSGMTYEILDSTIIAHAIPCNSHAPADNKKAIR